MEYLRRNGAHHEKGRQHQPVERIGDDEGAVGRKEEEIEEQEGKRGEGQTEAAPPVQRARQNDQQVEEGDVRLVEALTEGEEREGDRDEGADPREPDDPSATLAA